MPKINKPKGTNDLYKESLYKQNYLKDLFADYLTRYGYKQIETPVFENMEVFKRENDTSDMVNKEMYALDDDRYALRPEGTAGVIRSYAENKLYADEAPVKLFYMEKMYRKERPQKGRYREFTQLGIENIGPKSPIIDAEVIALAFSFLKKAGISGIEVLINSLGDEASRKQYQKVLKEYFEKHRDSLCEDCQRRIDTNPLRILDCKVDRDSEVLKNVPKIDDYLSVDSKEYFARVLAYLKEMDIPFRIDQKLVRGLDYYTDTVFEIVSTNSESGAQSTIIGGGRYDNLVEYFDAPATSGIGFAMGLERLIILADAEGVLEVPEDKCDVYLIDLTGGDPRVVSLALKLRNEGFVTELNVYNRKLKAQFKSAERYSARNIIIVGEDELSNQTVNVKNSESKDQKTIPMASLINYLKEN